MQEAERPLRRGRGADTSRGLLLIVTLALGFSAALADPGECRDWEEEGCTMPCEAADSCDVTADCGPGASCVHDDCRPSVCICEDGVDYCSDDCVGRCMQGVPTTSEWGLLVFGATLLALGVFVFRSAR